METSETEGENDQNAIQMPFKPEAGWKPDFSDLSDDERRSIHLSSSDDTSSSSGEEEVNYTIPRMQDDILNKKPVQPRRREKIPIKPPARKLDYPETDFNDDMVFTAPEERGPRDEHK